MSVKNNIFETMDNSNLNTQYDIPWSYFGIFKNIKSWNESAEEFMNYIPLDDMEAVK